MKKNIHKLIVSFMLIVSFTTSPIISIIPNNEVLVYAAPGVENRTFTKGDGTEKGIRACLWKGIRELRDKVKKRLDYDEKNVIYRKKLLERTMECFYDNQYPYDLNKPDQGLPIVRIGDVNNDQADADGVGAKYDHSYQALLDDVNYGEILTIFSLSDQVHLAKSDGFIWGTNNFDDFEEFLTSPKCMPYMYEIQCWWIPHFHGEKEIVHGDGSIETIVKDYDRGEYDNAYDAAPISHGGSVPDSEWVDGVECFYESFWIKTYVKPFGLREEFSIVYPDIDYVEAYELDHVDFDMHKNSDLLDYQERLLRLYQRGSKVVVRYGTDNQKFVRGTKIKKTPYKSTFCELGVAFDEERSEHSGIYEELLNDEWLIAKNQNGQGRSAWYYIEKTYNETLDKIQWSRTGTPEVFNGETYEEILKKFEEGTYSLEDFMNFYIYQIDVQNDSRLTGLCCFSSYMMCIQYLTGTQYDTQTLASLAKQFCQSDGTCDTSGLLAHFGIKGDAGAGSEHAMDPAGISAALQSGKTVIGHVRNGTIGGKHYDGHFFVISGVSGGGYTILDPGSKYSYAPQRTMTQDEVMRWCGGGYRVIG